MKWVAIAFAILWTAGAARAQSDHFAYDPEKASKAAWFQRDYGNMLACVAEMTPKEMYLGSRSKIKGIILANCDYIARDRPLYGLSFAQTQAMTAKIVDQQIDALMSNGQ